MNDMHWTLTIADDVRVCVPSDIRLMTPYVLLEQEDWFESELHFLRELVQPGMGVLDIGANHGVYALSFAKRLYGHGQVIAFEPATTPAEMLQHSIIENEFEDVLTLLRLGLSDHEGQATLHINANSELNSLSTDSASNHKTETVRLTTLDALLDSPEWPGKFVVDILKLDAEGEEIRILKGGVRFFDEQDPLVMFEWKHGNTLNIGLMEAFASLGMHCYRLVPGLAALVPVMLDENLDDYQLNLFACKPSCADRLRASGKLLNTDDLNSAAESPTQHWSNALSKLPYVATIRHDGQSIAAWQTVDHSQNQDWPVYEIALNAYLSAADSQQALSARWAWLKQSRLLVEALMVAGDNHLATQMLHIRVLNDCGARAAAVEANADLVKLLGEDLQIRFDRPFLPLLASYDRRQPHESIDSWIRAQIFEGLDIRRAYSSYFHKDLRLLQGLSENPNRSPEMDRRFVLLSLATGKEVTLSAESPLYKEQPTSEHRNVVWWRQLMDAAKNETRN